VSSQAVFLSHGGCHHKPFFIFFSQGMCPLEAVLINDSSIKLVPSFAIYYLKSMLQRELYFYTATIYKWKPLIKEFNLEPVITQSLSYLCQKECLRVYGFVIMPNHVHFIWELLQNNGKESPVSSFMKFTAHQFQSWLEQNAPRVLNEYRVDWHSRNYNFWQTKADWFLLT
jgi:REP element-mobilizing transposase RayT